MFPTFQTPQVLKTVRTTEPSGSYYCYSPLNPNLAAPHDGRRSCDDRPLNASVLTAPPAALTSVAAELAEDHHQPNAPGNESASDAPHRALGHPSDRLCALPPRDLVPSAGPGRSPSTSATATATAAAAVAATAASGATTNESDKPSKGTARRRACLRVEHRSSPRPRCPPGTSTFPPITPSQRGPGGSRVSEAPCVGF